MTFQSEPAAGEPNLYLFARASVQELRDDPPPADAAPATSPGGAAPASPAVPDKAAPQPEKGP